jgi:hypothetical protein
MLAISAVDIDVRSVTIGIHAEATMPNAPFGESPVSENCASDPEWIDLLRDPELPEPDNFRENAFKLMKALGSWPATRSLTLDPVVEAQMREAVDYLADHLFAKEPQ